MVKLEPSGQQKGRTFALAMLFESGLGFLGIAFAWWRGIPLFSRLELTSDAISRGALACLPMLLLLWAATTASWGPLVRLRQQVESLVRELFVGSHWLEIALISLAAGVGEEIFFRGALQPWLASLVNPMFALCAVSLLFGMAHALSITYLVAATIIGFYLGWLAMEYDDLVAPIVAHALYDFVALVYVQRRVRRNVPPAA
ncbi:MAG: CPBP family intramembrane metalloprotease [Pirellulales bacterium]|nr:CPBP family intramembrane metalloprotease [Pirellulales bacterium]